MHTPLPDLDRAARVPLAAQIAGYYAKVIHDGHMRSGDRLPPIREIARACEVTRATVQDAYRQLAEKGLVEGTVGRGTTVLGAQLVESAKPDLGTNRLSPYAEAALRQGREMPGAPPLRSGRALVANFAELAPDGARFPVDEWRAAMDNVLQRRGAELLGYGHATNGLLELRTLLAERARDIDPRIGPDDILITAGAQQALDLVLRTCCAPGDTVVVSAPSYHQMHGLLRAHGVHVVQVPFGTQGLDLDRLTRVLARGGVRLVYLMPTFHNPTGRTLDSRSRRQLIDLFARTRVPIVEDEYQQQLRFLGEPLPTLRQLDPRGLTVTVATFSKGLFPGLRVGWVQAGPQLREPMAAVKRFVDLETSPLLQAAVVEFAERGALEACLDAVCGELRVRHAALDRVFAAAMPADCSWTTPEGGHLSWLELPEPGDGDRLAELAAARGVVVVPGRVFEPHDRPSRGVRLSLSRAAVPQVEAGARILADCARALLQPASIPTSRSFL